MSFAFQTAVGPQMRWRKMEDRKTFSGMLRVLNQKAFAEVRSVLLASHFFVKSLKAHHACFLQVSVGDVVWGYEHPLVILGNEVRDEDDKVPGDKYGFFVGKNGSSRGILRALTGTQDPMEVGRVLQFDGEERLDFWRDGQGDRCNEIRWATFFRKAKLAVFVTLWKKISTCLLPP